MGATGSNDMLPELSQERSRHRKGRVGTPEICFPDGQIFYRHDGEEYKDVVERIRPLPDVIAEDDCESIGGKDEMIYPNLKPELRNKIRSIVVKEFEGIDDVPDRISELTK